MKIKSAEPLYRVLEEAFSIAEQPLTAAQLMDISTVKQAATERYGKDVQTTTNKLSDMLGFMWRRGVVKRYDATEATTKARYAYGKKERAIAPALSAISPPTRLTAIKPTFTITESDNEVTIAFENVTILVRKNT
jgi:hypothetical protein